MDLRYAYANARIKGMKGCLLSESKMSELLRVKSLNEVVGLLEETSYKNAFVECSVKYSGQELVDAALHLDFVNALRKLMRIIPDCARKDFDAIVAREWEMEDLKAIIARKALKQEVAATDLINLGGKEKRREVEKLAAVADIDSLLARFQKSEFYKHVFDEATISEYKQSKDFRVLARALDNYYYNKLFETVKKIKDKHVVALIDSKMDFVNAMVVLRMKKDGFSNALIQERLAVCLHPRHLKRLLKAKSFEDCVRVAVKEFRLPAGAAEKVFETNSLIPLEVALEKKFVEETLRSFRISVLGFGVVLGYLYLKQVEVANLRKIVCSLAYGLEEKAKKEMVFGIGE